MPACSHCWIFQPACSALIFKLRTEVPDAIEHCLQHWWRSIALACAAPSHDTVHKTIVSTVLKLYVRAQSSQNSSATGDVQDSAHATSGGGAFTLRGLLALRAAIDGVGTQCAMLVTGRSRSDHSFLKAAHGFKAGGSTGTLCHIDRGTKCH
jgi:hypothetical protein